MQFVLDNIKFPVPYVELSTDISPDEVNQIYHYFVDITKTNFTTPSYTRSHHFEDSIWLRFTNGCMHDDIWDSEDAWDKFFNDFLKLPKTDEFRQFYKEARLVFKPIIFKMKQALEIHTGKKHPIQGVEVNMIPAGGHIKAHIDNHPADHCTHRVHLVLETNDQAYMLCNNEKRHFDRGQCFIFNNKMLHSVHNEGSTPRTHLVVDFLQLKD